MSDAWLSKLAGHLFIIAEHAEGTRFEAMETGEVKDLVEWAQDRDVADRTVDAYKAVIKRFWRWLYDLPKGEHPEMVDWVNTGGSSNGSGTLPKDLLTREDIDALKDACRNPRDRAFIAMLYETGARIGELIDLTVGDIEDHQHGRKVVIDGKTGQRRLPLLEVVLARNETTIVLLESERRGAVALVLEFHAVRERTCIGRQPYFVSISRSRINAISDRVRYPYQEFGRIDRLSAHGASRW